MLQDFQNSSESRAQVLAAMIIAVGLTAVLLVSCDGGTSQTPGTLPADVVAADLNTVISEGADNSRRGGVLVLDTDDCGVFDPAIDLASGSILPNLRLINEIHSGLTRISSDAPYTAEPELASSYEMQSGGRRWEFTLRPDLKFSDGSPLDSSHIKWSWERALAKATPPSRAHKVLGNIVGATQIVNGTSEELSGVRLIDDQRITVDLSAPQTDFPTLLADPIASVVQPDDARLWDDLWTNHKSNPSTTLQRATRVPEELPVGAGPFRLVAYETPSRVMEGFDGENTCTLQRNEHYWHPSKPFLDGVMANANPNLFAFDNDSTSRQIAAMQAGALDFAVMDASASIPQSGQTSEGFVIALAPLGVHSRFLVFDPLVPPFDDINVRRALVQSVDVSRGANRFETEPTYGLVPPDFLPTGAGVETLLYSPFVAKAEFDSTSFANTAGGPALIRQLDTLGYVDPVMASVLNAWNEVLGIDIESIATIEDDEAGIADIRYDHSLPIPAGVLGAAIGAFPENSSRTEFAELRRLLDDAIAEVDPNQRATKFVELEQRMIDDAYVLPILMVETGRVLTLQPWVNDLQYPKFTGSAFRDLWFNDDAPQRTIPTR